MPILRTLFFLLLLVSTTSADDAAFNGYDQYAREALADWGVPGMSIAVVKGDTVLFANGYGSRSIDKDDAVDCQTVFPIASVTKTFNAVAIAMLVDEGKFNWNDPIVKHLPEFRLRDDYLTKEATLADLLSHRTCLEDPVLLSYTGVDRQTLIERADQLGSVAPFRSNCGYNNLMIDVTGEVLERAAGRSWEQLISERIFRPLRMKNTVADVERLANMPNRATVYVDFEDSLRADPTWTLPLSEGWKRYRKASRPDGSICSNVEDMARFLVLHLCDGEFRGQRLLEKETVLEMQALHSTAAIKSNRDSKLPYPKFVFGYGFGWEIRDYQGRKVVMHRGSTGAVLALMPEENLGLVVLTNLNRGLQYMVMHDTFDRLLGIPRSWTNKDWTSQILETERRERRQLHEELAARRDPDRKQKLRLEEYAGIYTSNLFGDLVISHSADTLSMRLGPTTNCEAQLKHWQGERFRATFQIRHREDWFLTFQHSEFGTVSKIVITDIRLGREIASFLRAESD